MFQGRCWLTELQERAESVVQRSNQRKLGGGGGGYVQAGACGNGGGARKEAGSLRAPAGKQQTGSEGR